MKKRVFVGLSGGVDSSVAAHLLKKQGHDVVGVFIKTWQPDFLTCDWEKERLDAMRVAAHLGIPFMTFDAEKAYKEEVADYMIAEYKAGRTPNPDVMCNQHVKFGAFLSFAKEHGADAVATGHYARVSKDGEGYHLYRGMDESKDQSYFLWTLRQDQLAHILFPVGELPKKEVRRIAEKLKLPTAAKKDSQGICFLGQVDIEEFLSHYATLTPGDVLDVTGKVIGAHHGALIYTYGQRHGFEITEKNTTRTAHYVVDKDIDTNTITVDKTPPTSKDAVALEQTNIIQPFTTPIEAQFRYRGEVFPATITGNTLQLTTAVPRPSVGQSCVLYRGDECLGGGIIG